MSRRQLAMVMDLNKCIGCQTCTVACKTQWTNRNGREYMYWNNVETFPGSGYPKNWQTLGGGFDAAGDLQPGVIPNIEADYGVPWEYNFEALETGAQLEPHVQPTWGPNWDEDQGAGNFPSDNYFFYIPRICNHCTNPGCLSACRNPYRPRGTAPARCAFAARRSPSGRPPCSPGPSPWTSPRRTIPGGRRSRPAARGRPGCGGSPPPG